MSGTKPHSLLCRLGLHSYEDVSLHIWGQTARCTLCGKQWLVSGDGQTWVRLRENTPTDPHDAEDR